MSLVAPVIVDLSCLKQLESAQAGHRVIDAVREEAGHTLQALNQSLASSFHPWGLLNAELMWDVISSSPRRQDGVVGPHEKARFEQAKIVGYLTAIDAAWSHLREGKRPGNAFLRAINLRVLSSPGYSPGVWRNHPTFVGATDERLETARFIPLRPQNIPEALNAWVRIASTRVSGLEDRIRTCGFLYLLFISIHPFLDGNGRTGRVLLPVLFSHLGLTKQPVLMPSYLIERNREAHHQAIGQAVTTGSPTAWLDYFWDLTLSCLREAAAWMTTQHAMQDRMVGTLGRSRSSRSLIEVLLMTGEWNFEALATHLRRRPEDVEEQLKALARNEVVVFRDGVVCLAGGI